VRTNALLLTSFVVISACSAQSTYRAQPITRQAAQTQDQNAAMEEDDSEGEADGDAVPTSASGASAKTTETKPAAPAVRSSQGSGGATGLVEVPFTDSTGLASSYKINAPTDAGQKVYGLHIHLHGDGGGGDKDFPNKEARNDLIGVTVKAPNTTLTWGRAQGKPHAFYLNELIQKELLKKYNINQDRIYFSTVSGGSFFMVGSFIPEYGASYNSAAFVMCGGEAPRVAFADPKMLGKWRIHFEVTAGERADIMANVQASVNAYKSAAASAGVSSDVQAKLQTMSVQGPGGHCAFDNVAYTSGIQQAIDTKFKMILPP
jgi:hypothetical protein